MKNFEIWSEGYEITGNSSDAQLMAVVYADTFGEAIQLWLDADQSRWKYYRASPYGNPTFWGCRLFDNETDARKSFG